MAASIRLVFSGSALAASHTWCSAFANLSFPYGSSPMPPRMIVKSYFILMCISLILGESWAFDCLVRAQCLTERFTALPLDNTNIEYIHVYIKTR